jgi:hypothetical protein
VETAREKFFPVRESPSPLYDKGHPILGVFVHGRSFLEFWTPKVPLGSTEIPRGLKDKKVINATPKKGHWRQKKKSGLSRRTLVMLGRLANA